MKKILSRLAVLVLVAAGVLVVSGVAHAILPPPPPPPPPPTPCIDVEKFCADASDSLSPISFTGYVKNCGSVALNVQVLDLTTNEVLINGLILAPGASADFSGSYSPAQCGPSTNTVKAIGTTVSATTTIAVVLPPPVTVYDTDSATCLVPCDEGCTRTPGYWKTHSIFGPAPYDETWAQIGETTPFFLSGQSYYEVLWTEPAGGNAYYTLAHAYIAARLNVLSGASVPAEVQSAIMNATSLFQAYMPGYIGNLKGGDTLRKQFLYLSDLLDKYNNGLTGPGHCGGDNGSLCP